jgi:outer membrane protein OmpA-like peptidoglycan-associated protein
MAISEEKSPVVSETDVKNTSLKILGKSITNAAHDLLTNNDFISRTIGMNKSYDDVMFIVQMLGREPVSLLGNDFTFIYDHSRRIYQQGTTVASMMYGGGTHWCPKFTFYKEKPTIRFANVDSDPLNLIDRWVPNFEGNNTSKYKTNFFYAESNDGQINNKTVSPTGDSSPGTATGRRVESFDTLSTCDIVRKTNENFINGKFRTLISRFHTNSADSMDPTNPTQTAISTTYGMSHGRNLLKKEPDDSEGYDNPYCRVWTYHHQYHRILDAIRPFSVSADSAVKLETEERGTYDTLSFRTKKSERYKIEGGSERLDKYGSLNYRTGFVNIAPTAKISEYTSDGKKDNKSDSAISIKKCMFSIENLAWRDDKSDNKKYQKTGTSAEQRGPLGGRIMWFPPYDIEFSENVSVKWNSNEFIGRGENIYTYTNTERRGNLSFTMVIDHPSILDYWTGHKRNGRSNKGNPLSKGNAYGVDGIERLHGMDNQENTLLRFFAGCDILTAKPQKEYIPGKDKPETKEENTGNSTKAAETTKGTKKLCCVVYFPNNYSGVSDRNNPDRNINPIHYLVNGIGCQECIEETENNKIFESVPIPTFADRQISVCSGAVTDNTPCGGENKCSKVCNENGIVTEWTALGTTYGGYEVRSGSVSILDKTGVLNDNTNVRKKTFACLGKGIKGQFLTSKDAETRYGVSSSTRVYTLSKIIGSEAKKYNKDNMTGPEWLYRRYYYRVDDDYKNDVFNHSDSYIDAKSYNLNSNGYKKPYEKDGINKSSWIKQIDDVVEEGGKNKNDRCLVSFCDFFSVVDKDYGSADYLPTDSKNKEAVSDVINNKKILSVKVCGNASSAGTKSNNAALAKNRAETVIKWLKGCNDAFKIVEEDTGQQSKNPKIDKGNASSLSQKFWRSATIVIEYEDKEEEPISNQETTTNGVAVIDKNTQEKIDNLKANDSVFRTFYEDNKKNGYTDSKILEMWEKKKEEDKESSNTKSNGTEGPDIERYDNEGEFFELLEKKDPFLHNLITDKIRYFDPAYHAISPEGFNARLTFLHQCTRQGNTVGNSDNNSLPAYNLAFGRPPVCVLRLGDFYYTKIIINSLNINYENSQWDLNPEGIGVMPMFAKISIDFNFIGGSDLAGPIARLQNAVSFNYYANTGVYDDRAEAVEYNSNGSGKEVAYKPFIYMSGEEDNKKDNKKK